MAGGLEALLGLGQGAGGLFALNDAYKRLGAIGEDAYAGSQDIAGQIGENTQFQGYGITGPRGGSANVDSLGNTSFGLSQPQQGLADQLQGQAGSMFGLANQGIGAGANDIYGQLRAVMQPEEQRQNLALEERLAAQGRTGLRTAQYGGAPEQLALAKAQEEARTSAFYQARGQSQGEQLQAGQLGSLFNQNQYAPQNALLDLFGAGTQGFGFEDIGRRQGAAGQAEAQMGGLNALLGAGLGQANLIGQLGTGLLGGAGQGLQSYFNQNPEQGLGGLLTGAFGSLFG